MLDDLSLLVGRHILVGMTTMVDDRVTERTQFHGVVEAVTDRGVQILRSDGSRYTLPPDKRAFSLAPLGEYTLKETGEVVKDPDFLSQWTVYQNH